MRISAKATAGLVVVTAVSSLVIAFSGASDTAAAAMAFIPARLSGALDVAGAVPVFLTPLTATLVHLGLAHLVMNLLLLALCGHQVERVIGGGPLLLLYAVGAYFSAAAYWLVAPSSTLPGLGAGGAVSALIGAYAVSFGRPKPLVANLRLNRWLNVLWLMAAWIVLQLMMAILLGLQDYLLATVAAGVGGFLAGVILQKPLLLWRYRRA